MIFEKWLNDFKRRGGGGKCSKKEGGVNDL